MNKYSLVVVTVTYGERAHLLRQMLDAVYDMDVSKVVVVDNGASWPADIKLDAAYSDLIHFVAMGRNTGSAQGFATGIQRALELGAEYIWLLDDDNRPHKDTLRKLREAYLNAAAHTSRDRLAVLAFRPEHQADVATGVPPHRVNPRANSFRGFHILDIPYKIWRRTPWGRPQMCGSLPATIAMDMAPYSGLLFHRDLIQSIGFPRTDFVLYADDSEFTYRVSKKGGSILLVTAAMLDDLESSWNVKSRYSNGFIGNLKGSSDFRAYYGMRNGVYLDTISLRGKGFIFRVNRTAYMTILFLFSIALKRRSRYDILREAVDAGLSGRLGLSQRFPL